MELVTQFTGLVCAMAGLFIGYSLSTSKEQKEAVTELKRFVRIKYEANKKIMQHSDNVSGPWSDVYFVRLGQKSIRTGESNVDCWV